VGGEQMKNVKEKEVEIKFEIEIKSLEPNGIEIIKDVLKEIEEKTGGKIKYVSAPIYRLEFITNDPKKDERRILSALEKLKAKFSNLSFRRI
jgi:translation initiation factor 2 alpha subunit (eIF-2alpha)